MKIDVSSLLHYGTQFLMQLKSLWVNYHNYIYSTATSLIAYWFSRREASRERANNRKLEQFKLLLGFKYELEDNFAKLSRYFTVLRENAPKIVGHGVVISGPTPRRQKLSATYWKDNHTNTLILSRELIVSLKPYYDYVEDYNQMPDQNNTENVQKQGSILMDKIVKEIRKIDPDFPLLSQIG